MRIKNTSDFDAELVREIIAFTRPSGISNFDVMLKKHGGFYGRGRAYGKGSGYHSTANPFIVVAIGKEHAGDWSLLRDKGGYLPQKIYTRTEYLVMLFAHELRHLWQHKVKKGYRVWGARGQMSERDADAYAIRKVREWRQIHNKGILNA